MKKIVILVLLMVLVLGSVLADDSASSGSSVRLKYTKNPTSGVLSIVYMMNETGNTNLAGEGNDIEDDHSYDIEKESSTKYPFVITWRGNMTEDDGYLITFSTEGWKHVLSERDNIAPVAVSLNVGVLSDQNPNIEGNQVYGSVIDNEANSIHLNVPALTNTDGSLPLRIAEFSPSWTSPKNPTAGLWVCSINVRVDSI